MIKAKGNFGIVNKLIPLALLIILLLDVNLFSQVLYKVEVKNQTLVINDSAYGGINTVYFEIWLTQNGGPGPLYLADADYKFNFNVANFTTPTIEYVANSAQLYNSSGVLITTYEASIATSFTSPNELDINVQPPVFSNQTQFDARVAKIDGTPSKHKLGKFVVYTALLQGTLGLVWKTGIGGTVTTSFSPTTPWNSSQATGTLIVIPNLPLSVEHLSTGVPTKYDMSQNYPNPFNPSTKIKFDVPKALNIKLSVYDITGREISILVNEKVSPGYYEVEFNGANYPSGVYFYTITSGDFKETKRMILIK